MHDAHATPPDLPETTLPPGRRGAAGAAYTWLKREILSGRIRPGQTLSENEIASQMGVSRTPVREAIIRLESEGLLNVRPQVGTVVAPIDLDQVADGQFLREAIECRSARLAAGRVRPADVRELKSLLRDQARAVARNDQAGFIALDDRMHQHIVAMAGRPNVWRAVEDVKAQLDRVRVLSLEDPSWLAAVLAQHEAIVRHVLEGDGNAASKAMEAHLRTVFSSIDAIAVERPEYFRGDPVASRSGTPPEPPPPKPARRNP
ncbi:MAG: GntR family transcriptional regulator [Burkholderiales bacterium]|nr:GntR family transcriptional regulator [Burkholderiales bacterium]